MIVAEHYMGSYGGCPTPEFVFYVGPTRDNLLADRQDFERRTQDVKRLLDPLFPKFVELAGALEQAFGKPVARLHAEVGTGGWKGTICPILRINSIRSSLVTGGFYPRVCPEVGEALCRSLAEILHADWVACQHFFGKPFQVEYVAGREVCHE